MAGKSAKLNSKTLEEIELLTSLTAAERVCRVGVSQNLGMLNALDL
jgi:hypothetical protein